MINCGKVKDKPSETCQQQTYSQALQLLWLSVMGRYFCWPTVTSISKQNSQAAIDSLYDQILGVLVSYYFLFQACRNVFFPLTCNDGHDVLLRLHDQGTANDALNRLIILQHPVQSLLPNLWIHFMQSVVQSPLHIFSPVSKGQGDVLTSRNNRDQPSICTVGHKWIQWDHLQWRYGRSGGGRKTFGNRVKHLSALKEDLLSLLNSKLGQIVKHLTTWKLSSVIPLFSRWRMPWSVR